MDRYSDTILLIRHITKQHQKVNKAWNYISYHSNMVNNTVNKTKEKNLIHSQLSTWPSRKSRCKTI